MQAYLLVADDMMDESLTRRGQPCWYRRDDVGLTAINDSLMLEACVYSLLHLHFSEKPYYADLVNEFHVVRNDKLVTSFDQIFR